MASPLTEARWRQLEALFHEASQLSSHDRHAFIARETADEPELARELRGMLAHEAAAAQQIAGVIGQVAARLGPSSDWAGRRLGAYRIVREIGRGGMGLVFEAVRDDDEYRKTVALKVPPLWTDPALVRERFRLERQILAELEHPNIARFLDGGTEDGVPYFVMEYVEGVPITAYCGQHRLNLPGRLSLFLQVCGAVHYAHQSLVVHRDLKPANILVAGDGTLKLLDFGIAKLLDPIAESGAAATMEMRWTPDYTSPEQVQGRAATMRTDVYSLGLILYELLTGERAQIADPTSPVTLERSICETLPVAPSERLVARGDRVGGGRLRGDLDTIAMTAIRKEPERRYTSAAALADDLGRYLDGRPILARPSTPIYRAGKFLRRHRTGVAAATVVAVSLVAGLGAAIFEGRRAERRFQQVRSLANTFVFDVHDQIESLPGATAARKSIVQTALVYLESLRQDARNDPALARELAAAYQKVGTAQGAPLRANLGDPAGAIASYTRAQDLLLPLANRGDRKARHRLVSLYAVLATVRQAQGDLTATTDALARAREIGDALLVETPDDAELLAAVADANSMTARVAVAGGSLQQAEQAARRSLVLTERMVAIAPANREYRDDVASAHNALGQTLHMGEGIAAAIEHFRAAIAIREQLEKEEPDNGEFKRKLLVSYGNLGDALGYQPGRNIGDAANAAAAFEKAVALADWARQRDSSDRRALFDLASALLRLGSVEAENPARASQSLERLETGGRLVRQLLSEDPRSERYEWVLSLIELKIGERLAAQGSASQAAQHLESARLAASQLKNGQNKRTGLVVSTVHLAELKARVGDREAAALVDFGASELTARPLASAYTDAVERAELGRAYAALARRGAPAERAEWAQKAAAAFHDSLAHWRAAKLAPPVEPQRAKHIAEVQTALTELASSAHRRPRS